MSTVNSSLRPVWAAIVGIALYSAMDAVMKGAAIAVGAYSAYLLRCTVGILFLAPLWWWQERRFPAPNVLRIHFTRGTVVAFMGWTFFAALVRLPIAEAIAISFVAPLLALFLARVVLGEEILPRSVAGALLGLLGVLVIVAGRIGRESLDREAAIGIVLVLISAMLFAWNLILQKQQAAVSSPLEASTFQNGVVTLVLGLGAPFLLHWPQGETWALLGAGALLAIGASMLFIWAYARSEAQRLVPIEYTGFLWASLLGWIFFGEPVRPATATGALLITAGCWIATRQRRTEQSAL